MKDRLFNLGKINFGGWYTVLLSEGKLELRAFHFFFAGSSDVVVLSGTAALIMIPETDCPVLQSLTLLQHILDKRSIQYGLLAFKLLAKSFICLFDLPDVNFLSLNLIKKGILPYSSGRASE